MKKLIFILLCFSLLTFGSSARIIEVAPAGAWGLGIIASGGGGGPDVTAPEWSSTTVAADGDEVTVVFSENLNDTALGGGEFDLDCDGASGADNVLVYASGDGTNTWVFAATSTVQSGESRTTGFDGAANEAEDDAGNDLADYGPESVTNNSTQGAEGLEFAETFDFTGQITANDSWTATSNGNVTNFVGDSTYAYMSAGNDYNYYHGVYITASGGITQAVKMKMGEASINTSLYNGYGALLRCEAANPTGDCYRLYVKANNTGVVRFATDYMTDFTSTDYGSDVTIDAITDGYWIGFAVTGTGAITVFSFWDFGTTDDPGAYSTWGDPTQTLDDTGLASYVDTGDYMGFFLSWHTSAPHNTVNDWAGGGW